VDGELELAVSHGVVVELVGKFPEDEAAERLVAEMVLERRDAGDGRAAYAERRNAVRDHLFRFGNDLKDRAAHRFERAALGLLEIAQVSINLLGGHGRESRQGDAVTDMRRSEE